MIDQGCSLSQEGHAPGGGAKSHGLRWRQRVCASYVEYLRYGSLPFFAVTLRQTEDWKMKCPHCGILFHDSWTEGEIKRPALTGWYYRTANCPACKQMTIALAPPLEGAQLERDRKWRQVHPIGSNRGPVSPEVPKPIATDYVEACRVLPLSAKASAALSRRCLQTMLHDQDYKDRDLGKEVEQLLNVGVLPKHIHATVDAIRNFGNFSAHPINDKTSLQIIDVEPHEAEWCLEILEALFDHFYVQPAAAAAKKKALDAKLLATGKPPTK
jgi:Domain of unknown function (DUF4145)